jgi:hypothetical protein
MKTAICKTLIWICFIGSACQWCLGQGKVVVRVDDPVATHCIDATAEDVTIYVRRIFTEKQKNGIFTKENTAGVLVQATLNGDNNGQQQTVKVPSVDLVSVADEKPGRISLPLEYQIASYFKLRQDTTITSDMNIAIQFAKTQGRNAFGDVLNLAGKALDKVSIPGNPYTQTASKFLQFANSAIDDTTSKKQSVPFANVALAFNKGPQPNIQACESAGKERTGAVAVLLSAGLPNSALVPMTNTDETYCFKYSSGSTYELLAAKKVGGSCPKDAAAFSGVNNDYVMFLISASPTAKSAGGPELPEVTESRNRCHNAGLPAEACGVPK